MARYLSAGEVESPLEEEFYVQMSKYMRPELRLESQFEVSNYFIDFVCGRVGFECDGKEFHKNKRADHYRDERILKSGTLRTLYRIRGCDLWYHPDDVMFIISAWEPWMFSERGLVNLRILASDDACKAMRQIAEMGRACWEGHDYPISVGYQNYTLTMWRKEAHREHYRKPAKPQAPLPEVSKWPDVLKEGDVLKEKQA